MKSIPGLPAQWPGGNRELLSGISIQKMVMGNSAFPSAARPNQRATYQPFNILVDNNLNAIVNSFRYHEKYTRYIMLGSRPNWVV